MTPPLFLIDHLPIVDVVLLTGDEGRHAAQSMRLQPGERMLLGDGRGGLCECTVRERHADGLVLRVDARRNEPAPTPSLLAVQALPKGDRGELAVEMMTELGVDTIVPWQANRSITRWARDRGERSWRKWETTAREAGKQCRRLRLPRIGPLVGSRELLDLCLTHPTLLLHEEAKLSIADVELPTEGVLAIVIGPEGGLDDAELNAFTEAGAVPVRMGPSVLRSSTAGAAAVAALSLRLGRWAL